MFNKSGPLLYEKQQAETYESEEFQIKRGQIPVVGHCVL